MIQTAALDAQAAELNLHISPRQIVDDAMASPNFRDAKGKFSPEVFSRALAQYGLNEAMFVETEMRNRARSAVTGGPSARRPQPCSSGWQRRCEITLDHGWPISSMTSPTTKQRCRNRSKPAGRALSAR